MEYLLEKTCPKRQNSGNTFDFKAISTAFVPTTLLLVFDFVKIGEYEPDDKENQ